MGCTTDPGTNSTTADAKAAIKSQVRTSQRIIAQGQLVPRAGMLRILTAPGDVVEEILVSPGEPVAKGQELVRLRSSALRASQLATLEKRAAEAEKQQVAAANQARLKVDAARMQARQADALVASLQRQEALLKLAEKHLNNSRSILKRLESIAADPATRSFVSQLEIDRQRVAVEGAELEYARQDEALKQAREAGTWSQALAEQQSLGAQAALEAAVSSAAVEIVRSEVTTAQQLNEQARVKSPIDGIVLSVDTSIGDTTSQIPLVQLADLSRINCEAEVYQTDAARVRVGQQAILRSDAFRGELRGIVERIDRVVGRPKLRPTDPLARVDFRTLPVVISLSAEDVARAANWLQLQVEVEIEVDGTDSDPALHSLDSASSKQPLPKKNKG